MPADGSSPLRPLVLPGVILLIVVCLSSTNVRTQEWKPRLAGLVQDWSTRHAIFVRDGSAASVAAIQRDPRALMAWQVAQISRARAERASRNEALVPSDENGLRFRRDRWFGPAQSQTPDSDWSVNLTATGATGATADDMFPAKFSFDTSAGSASCSGDFVVFPVDQTPSSTAENLMAFDNLYSGSGPAGLCGALPTVMWSYEIGGGPVVTSPALSFDGTKVAFVETSGGHVHFHVVAWKSGDGVTSGSLQSPFAPSAGTLVSNAPVAGSGTYTDLPLGPIGDSDSLSSPYIDYMNDTAYVGDDKGNVVRIIDVFCTVNALCSLPSPPPPSIDRTWGSPLNGFVATVCSGKLTGPIADSAATGNVFVGCADGKLYGLNSSGTALSPASVTVGDGTATGGIVDPPIVDGADGFVYGFAGSSGSGGIVVQARTTNLATSLSASLGKKGVAKIHDGAFNDAYFDNATSTTWLLYAQGYNGGGNQTLLYSIAFDSSRNMNGAVHSVNLHETPSECSPLTEFLNGTDWLFGSCAGTSTIANFNISTTLPSGPTATHAATGGTSGIIVDNVSPSPQASSVYFTNLGSASCTTGGTGFCAVKLTQSGLK